METKKIILPHVIASDAPEHFLRDLNNFKSGKTIVKEIISTSAIIAGVQQAHGGAVGITKIVISAYLEFECTDEEAKQFRLHQSLLMQK